jgi:S1-C subfamily serine protease
MTNTSSLHLRITAMPALVLVALVLTASSSMAATTSLRSIASASNVQVVTPGAVDSIVAADTATNNQANSSLSLTLQNSHETCLEQVLDDATYRGDQAAGSNTLGGSFDQVPTRSFVPRESRYPAFFSVLAEDRASGEPSTNDLLTYVKTSPSARWKLSSGSEILGPTSTGVAVPIAATDSGGYVTTLGTGTADGLVLAPDELAARVAKAFTAEASSGRLPSGITAEFGPNDAADPHAIATSYAGLGSVTTTFSATIPSAAATGTPSPDCPYPAIGLANGGALVPFAVFEKIAVQVRTGDVVVQPPNRSTLGVLLAPGTYSSVTMEMGDMGVAIVPPAGSHASIDVIGQATEGLGATGVAGAGSSSSRAVGGPADAAKIAGGVNPKLVDIETTLSYANEEAFGTGMLLTSSGEVLTNNHVIEDASSINVTDVGNGRTYKAKVVGYDPTADLAVLQLEDASGLATVSLGSSSSVRKGEPVVGIGNAGGTGGTPSFAGGRVIALGQSITANDAADGTSEQLTGLMETNANIQPGDSGGPLVNASGKVIGIDTAASAGFSFGQAESAATQAFSIPIDTALKVAGEITTGRSSPLVHIGPTGFLGVQFASQNGGRRGFGQPPPSSSGAEIESVVSGSPASRAGLVAGDTIVSFAGRSVTSANTLMTTIASEKPGVTVSLGYNDFLGSEHTVTVQLASGPPQ